MSGMDDIWRQLVGIVLGGACVFSANFATAQITPDRTLPNNSGVTINGSTFTITGRGGLPPSPDEPLTSDVVWSDTRLPVTRARHQHKTHTSLPKPEPIAIIPATGWVFNDKGEVTLISRVSNATSSRTPISCPAR